jgi:anti-anti-sigma factor
MSSYRMEHTDDGCRLTVNGGLTVVLVPELQQALKTEVDNGTQQITFDLSETRMVDSSGIGLLIAASNSLSQKNGRLSVINTAPEILRLMQSMRLITRLNITGRGGQGAQP